jgi:hypothetical protein
LGGENQSGKKWGLWQGEVEVKEPKRAPQEKKKSDLLTITEDLLRAYPKVAGMDQHSCLHFFAASGTIFAVQRALVISALWDFAWLSIGIPNLVGA